MVPELGWLIRKIETLRLEMDGLVNDHAEMLAGLSAERRVSATNLLHYLALRRHDLRELQERLAELGLSSLGRTEGYVMTGLGAVLRVLKRLDGNGWKDEAGACTRSQGRELLGKNAESLLGAMPVGRTARIMVTMPSEAATDYDLVKRLAEAGMNCVRINCAHDGEDAWLGMLRNLRLVEKQTGLRCKVQLDLAGPKLRTGSIRPAVQVLHVQPKKDAYGRVTRKARIWMTSSTRPEPAPAEADSVVPMPPRWLSGLEAGRNLKFVDTRGAKKSWRVLGKVGRSWWLEAQEAAYVAAGTLIEGAKVGLLPPLEQALTVKPGDVLWLVKGLKMGEGKRIGVTLDAVFESLKVGDAVWFDDGKIGGVVQELRDNEVGVQIRQAKAGGSKLRAEKGINLPDTRVEVPALSDDDLAALDFAKRHADLIAYSFVRTVDDIRLLKSKMGGSRLGVVLKIETREGFENLPELLLEGMAFDGLGVMIARGDLAVECGFERLAEVQEEILWFAEAAHVPVVWATQVLETLAKTGRPSRSEITDAAMGERAECVMLNKGPYVVQAVETLADILTRMAAHHSKKTPRLRRLGVAMDFGG